MSDHGRELVTGPSDQHNRDMLNSIEMKNLQRNSSLFKFFHTPVPPFSDNLFGFVLEENSNIFIGTENSQRLVEENI